MTQPIDQQDPPVEPANLRFLRRLVTVLTATMIIGVGLIVVLMVMRLNAAPAVPDFGVPLPGGVSALSTSITDSRIFVVGTDGTLYIYNTDKVLQQTVPLD